MRQLLFKTAAALTATTLLALGANAQTIGCTTGGPGGLIPTSGTGGGVGTVFPTTFPPFALALPLAVAATPAGATMVTEVTLNGLSHTWTNDVQFTVEDPAGIVYNLWCRPGGSCDFSGGNYSVVPAGTGCGQVFPTCVGVIPVAPGAYAQIYGTWPSGTQGVMNTDLSLIAPQVGTWTLRIYDWVGGDVGTLASWDICFGTAPPLLPPCSVPTLLAPANGSNLFSGNVNLTWSAVGGATSYDVDVDGIVTNVAASPFVFASTLGLHTWTVRANNAIGSGAYAAPFTFNDLGPNPCSELNTIAPFLSNNGGSVGGAMFFDINVLNPAGITLAQLDTNTSLAAGGAFGMNIYMKMGTYVGFETNQPAFTLMATGAGTSAGNDQHSVVEFPDFSIPPGIHGVALVMVGANNRYTNGTGANQFFANADLSITLGKAMNVPFVGTPFSPRCWNGTLRYNCTPPGPVSYCTAGTTTNGCLASISADNNPSVSMANACNITVAGVEGQKSGLLYYGLAQNAGVWCAGGSSVLCVKSPSQRTGTQSSGGTAGACDGSMTLDWNAYQTAHPAALGNPFAAGSTVDVQGWFRDPPACKTTNLSDAIEMTYDP